MNLEDPRLCHSPAVTRESHIRPRTKRAPCWMKRLKGSETVCKGGLKRISWFLQHSLGDADSPSARQVTELMFCCRRKEGRHQPQD